MHPLYSGGVDRFHIIRPRLSRVFAVFALALSTGACTTLIGDFIGDKTLSELAAQTPSGPSSEAERSLRKRHQSLMAVATLGGCYKRTATGFRARLPNEKPPDSCLGLLSELELLGQMIGAGPAPTGLEHVKPPELARKAQNGDQRAALELGIRFEKGIGLKLDLEKAKRLYRRAATDSGGPIWVYQPGVGDAPGRTVRIDTGPKIFGLKEAAERLDALEQREKSL